MRGGCDDLRDDEAISLYRIVQEGLTNASKHSAATEVAVDLERGATGRTRLTIVDNGQGFDAAVKRPGLGLLGMRERSEALGGTFAVEASLNAGVRLTVELPPRTQGAP